MDKSAYQEFRVSNIVKGTAPQDIDAYYWAGTNGDLCKVLGVVRHKRDYYALEVQALDASKPTVVFTGGDVMLYYAHYPEGVASAKLRAKYFYLEQLTAALREQQHMLVKSSSKVIDAIDALHTTIHESYKYDKLIDSFPDDCISWHMEQVELWQQLEKRTLKSRLGKR